MGEFDVLRRLLLLLALLFVLFGGSTCGPTRPAGEAGPPSSAPAVATSDLPPPLDPEGPREIVLGKLFAPDGSIETADRTSKFPQGALIHLSVETGDLPPGTPVIATWAAPDGSLTDQTQATIGGETYLVFTAPSASWAPGAGRVTVRIGEASRELLQREMPFEVSP